MFIFPVEIFEYVEVENDSVRRQWWAGENHQCERQSPTELDSIQNKKEWIWVDNCWKIDVSGHCKAIRGGWESCQNVVGGKTRYFSPERKFDPYHRFRRRRWYRIKKRLRREETYQHPTLIRDIQIDIDLNSISFHQPVVDITSKESSQEDNLNRPVLSRNESKSFVDVASEIDNDECFKVHFKIRDGIWSKPAVIPASGGGHGIVKLYSSRWPEITKNTSPRKRRRKTVDIVSNGLAAGIDSPSNIKFSVGNLSPSCYELSYQVSVLSGPWGEYSRLLLLYPRFILRNDSETWHFDVKQVGAPDSTSIHIECGSNVPFHWTDATLPELICIKPVRINASEKNNSGHRWSGGLGVRELGMIPLRIREEIGYKNDLKTSKVSFHQSEIRVVRSLIEIRSGTGGTGITISFKEESNNGEGSLYRIENHSPFPLWFAQDGVLANPQYETSLIPGQSDLTGQFERNGDIILSGEKVSFGLDVPFRQGKYVGRKAAALDELLTIRVALAPLSTRDGIESMKVVGLSYIGATFRLKPSNLRTFFPENVLSEMATLNVQGNVCADGPTRVVRFR
jgi:hypothetical protein